MVGNQDRGEAGEYVPTISPEYARRVRRWHEDAYLGARAEAGEHGQTFDHLGARLVVPPQVHPITGMSHLLGEAVLAEVGAEDRVLDMGTGSGVNAILAAFTARDVVAVDSNPYAVEAARANALRNAVSDRVTVEHGDVFGPVRGDFDVIVFDPPFRWFAPRDELESASTDENYRAMTTFFRHAPRYLRPGGRMLIFFGTSGDLGYLRILAERAGFGSRAVAHRRLTKDELAVDYYTYRMSR